MRVRSRTRRPSARNVASSSHCSVFSIAQCDRIARPRTAGSTGQRGFLIVLKYCPKFSTDVPCSPPPSLQTCTMFTPDLGSGRIQH